MIKRKGFITPKEASVIAGVSPVSIRSWCKRYKIGIKVVGRLLVDEKKLKSLIAGK